MKTTTWLLGIALAGLVALAGAGCKKEEAKPKAPLYGGVQIDLPKLQAALGNVGQTPSGQNLNNVLAKIRFGIRYQNYVDALVALDKLKDDPSLNDAQKKIVSDVLEQVKQAAANKEKQAASQPPAQ